MPKKFIIDDEKIYKIYKPQPNESKLISKYWDYKNQQDRLTTLFMFLLISISLILVFLLYLFYPTGKVIFNLESISADNESIFGNVGIILHKGELMPVDSIIKVNLHGQEKEISLNSLLAIDKETGSFFVENTRIEGEGEGYGIKGIKKTYPTVYFRLKIDKVEGKEVIGIPEQPVEENKTEQNLTQEGVAEEPTAKEPLITAQAIESSFIDGSITALENFLYTLSADEVASIEQGSVRNETQTLEDSVISLMAENGIATVSTNYHFEEQGFGPEYITDEEVVLAIDFSEFNITPEKGILQIELVYKNVSLIYGEKTITMQEEILANETEEENAILVNESIEENKTKEEITILEKPIFGIMAMPTGLEVKINSSLGTNTSVENITCWVKADDADNDNLTYNGFWYKNNEQQFDMWNSTFPATLSNYDSRDVAVDSQNNIISVGSTAWLQNISIVKYYPNGIQMWNRTFGGGSTEEKGYGAGVDNDDNIYAVGYVNFYAGNNNDVLIVKYNSSGGYLWNKTFDAGTFSSELAEDIDFFSNGDFVVAGGYEVDIIKYNSSGSLLWNLSTADFTIYDIAVDSQDNVIVTGTNNSCFVTNKFNSTGFQIWSVAPADCTDFFTRYAKGVAIDSQDNVVITGYTFDYDVVTIKYNSSGSQLWNVSFINGNSADNANDIAIDSRDNIYVLGNEAAGNEVFVLKYNSSGSEIWNKTSDTLAGNYGYGVVIDNQDNIIFSGVDDTSGFVEKIYGFNLANQTSGVFVNISGQDQSNLFADNVWRCEARAFDGSHYTNYTPASMTMLNVPLYCGVNITEKVTGQTNLSCSGTAINIVANNVLLDCDGNEITGSNNPGSYGVYINDYNNTQVSNCNIYNFSEGVFIVNSSNNTFSNNIFQDNANSGIKIQNSRFNVISSNSVYRSIYGLYADIALNNSILNNIFGQNSVAGIFWINSLSISISNNDVYDNDLYGILLNNDSNINIYDNNISINDLSGIFINYSNKNNVYNNHITNNGQSGFSVSGLNNAMYTNILTNNPKNIFFVNASNNSAYSNTITEGDYGIFADTNSQNNTFYDNYFNNSINAIASAFNYWNITQESRENILSGDYVGGNYWSDYPGNDSDKDGFGNTFLPWNSSGNISIGGDWLPLVAPFRTVKMISLTLNSTDSANTPAGDLTCWANATNENSNNITYHGFWHKNTEQIFDSISNISLLDISAYLDINDVAIDSQNNIVFSGITSGYLGYVVTVKLNSSGAIIWNNTYSNGRYAEGIEVDSKDNIIVTGYNSSNTDLRMITLKYNSSGSLLWNVSFNSSYGYDVAVDSNDSIIAVGTASSKMLIVKYNSSGSHVWNKTDSFGQYAYSVAADNQNNIVIVGGTYLTTLISKYSSNSTLLWNKSLAISPYGHTPSGIAVDSFNNIFITGSVVSPSYIYTAKIDKYGNLIWIKNFYLPYYNYGKSIIVDKQDNVLVGGVSQALGVLVKYDSDGNQLWYSKFDHSNAQSEGWDGIALDKKQDIVAAGGSEVAKYYGFTLDNQLPGQIINLSTIPSSSISNGDTWKCEAIAFDEGNYSKYKTSNELTLAYPGSFVGGRGACISSWSCGEPGTCIDGEAEVTCSDLNGCFRSTGMPSGCSLSGSQCTKIVSCEAKKEELNITNILELPEETHEEEVCTSIFECDEWGDCRVDYAIKNLIEGTYAHMQGTRIRSCVDTNGCASPHDETETCSVAVPVVINRTEWSDEDYLFVYEESTGQVVARLRTGSFYLAFTYASYLNSYEHCFNKIQDKDELGSDCGGGCIECFGSYDNKFFLGKIVIMIFLAGIFLYSLFDFIKFYINQGFSIFSSKKFEIDIDRLTRFVKEQKPRKV